MHRGTPWRIAVLCAGIGLLSMGRAEAAKGGLPACEAHLATCQSGLTQCETQLTECEATPKVIFPGDGQTGPALNYTDNGNGTFTDNDTQLIWEKKTATGCLNTDVHCVDNTYTWSAEGGNPFFPQPDGTLFTVFLATLNTPPCFAGHCDWRLPTVKELQSLVDYSKETNNMSFPVHPHAATSVPGATALSYYWSSTAVLGVPEFGLEWNVWVVNFQAAGGISVFSSVDQGAKSSSKPVRAIRGDQ